MQTYTWNLGDASLTFNNGTMVPFQKGELATTTRDMMYFITMFFYKCVRKRVVSWFVIIQQRIILRKRFIR
ncbi:hypothetical protein [Bacillus wiedmannii]|uniref:hypothetical protein n=1 Tax=Bacillus wiedmannii TaxID=1890302 RepID=UPI00147BB479|nr:hypothetical protein [Bacillus wiedmannii]